MYGLDFKAGNAATSHHDEHSQQNTTRLILPSSLGRHLFVRENYKGTQIFSCQTCSGKCRNHFSQGLSCIPKQGIFESIWFPCDKRGFLEVPKGSLELMEFALFFINFGS